MNSLTSYKKPRKIKTKEPAGEGRERSPGRTGVQVDGSERLGALESSKQRPFRQNCSTAHKHIRVSSITREPLAELPVGASQTPMVTNVEAWFLTETLPLPQNTYLCCSPEM